MNTSAAPCAICTVSSEGSRSPRRRVPRRLRAALATLATLAALATLLALTALPARAQPKAGPVDFGQREFASNCASCHGSGGRGNGPLADLLIKSPPDLTRLAARNGGILPMSRLYEVIGGTGVPAHGPRDMPVWGLDYRIQAAEHYMEAPYDPEAYTRARILALLEYIQRLQVK